MNYAWARYNLQGQNFYPKKGNECCRMNKSMCKWEREEKLKCTSVSKAQGGGYLFLKISTRWRWSGHLFVEHSKSNGNFFFNSSPWYPAGICQVSQEKLEKEAGCFKKVKCHAFCGAKILLIIRKLTLSLGLLSPPNPSFSGNCKLRKFY
jgi:hypothetical protein